MILALAITAFAVVMSGPAGREWFARRRALRDVPVARVLYLPSAACRNASDVPRCEEWLDSNDTISGP